MLSMMATKPPAATSGPSPTLPLPPAVPSVSQTHVPSPAREHAAGYLALSHGCWREEERVNHVFVSALLPLRLRPRRTWTRGERSLPVKAPFARKTRQVHSINIHLCDSSLEMV